MRIEWSYPLSPAKGWGQENYDFQEVSDADTEVRLPVFKPHHASLLKDACSLEEMLWQT